MKYKNTLFIFLALAIIMSMGGVLGVECNADLNGTKGYANGCTISSSLTFNGTYNISQNRTIVINGNNLILNCNNSLIYGNHTNISDGSSFEVGLYLGNTLIPQNVSIINCNIKYYYHPLKVYNGANNISLINLTLTNGVYNLYISNSSNIYASNLNLSISNRDNLFIEYVNNSIFNGLNLNMSHTGNPLVVVNSYSFNNSFYNILALGNTSSIAFNVYNSSYIFIENLSCTSTMYRCFGGGVNGNNIYLKNILINSSLGSAGGISTAGIVNSVFDNINIINVNNSFSINSGSINITLKNSNFINNTGKNSNQLECTSYSGTNTSNIFIINNTIGYSDIGIYSWKCSNLTISNNNIYNMTRLYDGFGVNIYFEQVRDAIISNNLINYNLEGIFVHNSSNINIYNNTFHELENNIKSNLLLANGREIPSAIAILEIFKTWVQDASENINDNILKIRSYHNENITILNNNFDLNCQVYLYSQGTTNITNDLSNYWFRSFQTPSERVDRTDLYISNFFNNVTTCQAGSCQMYAAQGYIGSAVPNWTNYTITKDYLYFKNLWYLTNTTIVFNLTSALVFNTNGTIYGSSNIADNNGQLNITLPPNNASYVLDNYALIDGVIRQNDPLAFTVDTLYIRKISSSLNSTINITVQLSADCTTIGTISYVSHSGAYKQNWTTGQYTCSNNLVTLNNIPIEPAAASNTFTLTYNQGIQNACSSGISMFSNTIFLVGLILTLIFISAIIVLLLSAFDVIPDLEIPGGVSISQLSMATVIIAAVALLFIVIIYIFESGICPAFGT
jgi:hypothetical protein